MREIVINHLIWSRFDGRIILGVLVILSDGSDSHSYVLNDLNREKLHLIEPGTFVSE